MEEQVRQNSATYTLKIDSHGLRIIIMMTIMIMILIAMVIFVKVIIVIVMMMLTVNTHVSYNKCVNSSKGCMQKTNKLTYCLSSWSANHDNDSDDDDDDSDGNGAIPTCYIE